MTDSHRDRNRHDRHRHVAETDVLGSLRELLEADRDAVVATVVDVDGRAYRRPGAKMVVDADGVNRGHITAGCLEDEVLALATDVLAADEPRLETYDLVADDDVWGLGLGCDGIIDVLLEPLDASYGPLVDAVEAAAPIGCVTVLDGETADGAAIPLGARAYYRDDGVTSVDDRIPDWLLEAVREPAAALVDGGDATTLTLDTPEGSVTVFVDGIRPPPRLVAFGSGHDVGPLVDLGTKNGFHVTVVGFRGAIDLEDRFPDAAEHISTTPADIAETVPLGENTYPVVMTHTVVDDRLTVDALLDTKVPYIGLMGPRERFEEILEELEAGRTIDADALETVYAPVGLDLGSGSPYGIATSVIAEIVAVHNGRAPRHLSERDGPIHDRIGDVCPGVDED